MPGLSITTASILAPPVRSPFLSKITSAPPFCPDSCALTRSGEKTLLQQRQVAFARLTVLSGTSLSFFGSNISNSTSGGLPFGWTTLYRNALFRPAFFESQNDLISGISAPQFGASHCTVLAHR